jgi:phospholipid/cholesterol/gamma-HCH transport system ATP-binding protein
VFKLPYTELRKVRQRFGVLFQGSALFDSINTFENVAFPLRYFTDQSDKEIEANVQDALKMVNLEGVGQKSTAELSGGMRKRVGVARAIVHQPDYIMYDEPTSGLDPQTSDEINELIMDMADNLDITSIVVTHDMHSVLKIAERVAFLDQGKLSWLGSIEEMRNTDYDPLRNFMKASEYHINTKSKKESV